MTLPLSHQQLLSGNKIYPLIPLFHKDFGDYWGHKKIFIMKEFLEQVHLAPVLFLLKDEHILARLLLY